MWYIAQYHPSALFSLRPANATTSGGKTLVTPTPYAVKMALLDVAIRVYGRAYAESWFPYLRDLKVAILLPDHFVVINTFVKILRPHKTGAKDHFGTGLEGPMGNTIAYRELVHYAGALHLAILSESEDAPPPLTTLLSHINYLGKRGGFVQWLGTQTVATLPDDYSLLNPEPGAPFLATGLLQMMDDCGPKMTFADANVYSGRRLRVGAANGRLLQPVVLPYQLERSSRSFSLYGRISDKSRSSLS
ncbi:MAG: hypothetical protein GX579_02845 [Chloroflexi bacterium]|nr:hypothetical protein [Chloroflexota bacterium]